MEKTEKNTNKTVVKIIIGAMAALLVLLIVGLIINVVRLSAANKRRNDLLEQSAYLDTVIDKNGKMLDYCKTTEFIEDYAREYLDMIYRDEHVIGVR